MKCKVVARMRSKKIEVIDKYDMQSRRRNMGDLHQDMNEELGKNVSSHVVWSCVHLHHVLK
jgi:hypothetical protein